jgi:DNA polymerase
MNELEVIAAEVRACQKCRLAATRTHAVPGEGNPNAKIMFIGEAPGFNEDQQGRPFVGAAGQLLNELLRMIGLDRREVYITNVCKCRPTTDGRLGPPQNRAPLPDEIAACSPYLERQIAALRPKVIVLLGRVSMGQIDSQRSMGQARGKPIRKDGIIYLPVYHPAAVFRQPELRRALEEDFRKIPGLLAEAEAERPEAATTPARAEQLSLF